MLDSASLRRIARWVLPVRMYCWLRSMYHWLRILWKLRLRMPVVRVHLGDLRRVTSIDRTFGYSRGKSIDRYYTEDFLAHQASDIRGRVLKINNDPFTRMIGDSRVATSNALNNKEGNPQATIVGDLTKAEHIPSDTFDCIIFTQTLQLIYDMRAAIETLYRILKPGGVLLATFPGVSQVSHKRRGNCWLWLFTQLSARRLFEEAFPAGNVEVEAYGNVLAATAFLHGLTVDELRRAELDYRDPDYEFLIALRAVKPESTS